MTGTDAALLTAAQEGDEDAFVALLERHAAHMLGIARGITEDFAMATEAVQSAACAAWAMRAEARPEAEAWLGRLARIHALSASRRIPLH